MLLRIAANVLTLIPGLGHVVLGRCGRGVLLFFGFVLFLNGSLLAPYLYSGKQVDRASRGSLVAAGLIWAYAVMDVFNITYWRRRRGFLRKKKRLYFAVHRAYAGRQLEEARGLLKRLLRMDPEDPASHYWLGLVYRDMGQIWRARKRFKQALWVDPEKKWRLHVQHQLARLRASRALGAS